MIYRRAFFSDTDTSAEEAVEDPFEAAPPAIEGTWVSNFGNMNIWNVTDTAFEFETVLSMGGVAAIGTRCRYCDLHRPIRRL
ncbi:hypothetical protein [Geomicrobium sp. JCM 19039]|uniref:hypothetical protein n=1 Tax=Geomicrobium sp. JCM 19039 TaxID=1460636 RepID=UPI00045F4517|nr:hypothetical protein [Geomicrobium sp. JCM 19039]GAK13973.1 hypothetical protein JCM19039_3860 [Geomicrobium sp. JCM 19039]